MVAESAFTAKVAFETIAAVAGFAKEGIGLYDALRDRKSESVGLLQKLIQSSGGAESRAFENIKKVYTALKDATPYVRNIVKKRVLIRLQTAIVVIGTSTFVIDQLPFISDRVAGTPYGWAIGIAEFIAVFFVFNWIPKIYELKQTSISGDAELIKQFEAGDIKNKVEEYVSKISKQADGLERNALSNYDSQLLIAYGSLAALVNLLETSMLVDNCRTGLILVESVLKEEIDTAVIALLEKANEDRKNPPSENRDLNSMQDYFVQKFKALGIEYLLKNDRYKDAFIAAIEKFHSDEDGIQTFRDTLRNQETYLFQNSFIESERLSMFERIGKILPKPKKR